jgi:hypothetical protein
MRGEGTCAALSRSIAALNAGRSCTSLFHHGEQGDKGKNKQEREDN